MTEITSQKKIVHLSKELTNSLSFYDNFITGVLVFSIFDGEIYRNEEAKKFILQNSLDKLVYPSFTALETETGETIPKNSQPVNLAFGGEKVKGIFKVGQSNKKRIKLNTLPFSNQKNLVLVSFVEYPLNREDKTTLQKNTSVSKPNEQSQQGIINALSSALIVLDENGIVNQTNRNWEIIKEKFKELRNIKVGINFFERINHYVENNNGLLFLSRGLKSLVKNQSECFEVELGLGENQNSWFVVLCTLLRENTKGIVITFQDISVKKRVERSLEASLSNYRNIYNLTPVMMHSVDRDGRLVSVSNYWLKKLGYQRREVIGKNLSDFLTKDSKRDFDSFLPEFFKKGFIFDVSYQFVTKTGDVLKTLLSSIEEDHGAVTPRSLAVVIDITPLKKAEHELKQNREELLEAQRIARIGSYEINYEKNKMTTSSVFDEILEIDNSIKKDKSLSDRIFGSEETEIANEKFKQMIREAKNFHYTGTAKTLQTQTEIWLECLGKPVYKGDRVVKMSGTIQDITKVKLHEFEIKKSLEEKDILMKEVHHRVKNNMQMISSLLALKALELNDPDSRNVFDECTLRIKSMAVVHEQLYKFYNVSEIEISDYLEHLRRGLSTLMITSQSNHSIRIDSEKFHMNIDTALLCGLIVSEIVSNAFKHGFNDISEGEVHVNFQYQGEKKILSVTNTGTKMPADILDAKTPSLGLSLIKTFTKQLKGELSLHPNNGLVVTF